MTDSFTRSWWKRKQSLCSSASQILTSCDYNKTWIHPYMCIHVCEWVFISVRLFMRELDLALCVCVCLWAVVQSKRINRLWCVSTSTKHPRIQQRAAPKPDDMKQISLDNKVSRSVDWPVTVVFSVSEINYQRFSSSQGPERSSPSHRNDSNYRMRFLYFLVQWVSVPADPTTTNTNTTTHTHTHILSNFLLSVPACTTSLQKGLLFKCTRNQLHFSVNKSVRRENGAMRRHVLLYSRTRRSSRPLSGKRVSLTGEKQCC